MVVLVSSTSTNGAVIRRIVMLAAPILIDRSMTNYCAKGSGKGNRINPRWRPNKKRNGHLSPRSRTNIYHLPALRPPLFLIGHYLVEFNWLRLSLSFLEVSSTDMRGTYSVLESVLRKFNKIFDTNLPYFICKEIQQRSSVECSSTHLKVYSSHLNWEAWLGSFHPQ